MLCCLLPGMMAAGNLQAQADPNWRTLSRVTFKEQYNNPAVYGAAKPIFTQEVLNLSGQTITLDGFIYPLGEKKASKNFVLSSLPISSCFFCGVGGPETVVEVYATEPIDYTDKPIKLRGKFIVSEYNPSGLLYTLENAELLD